MHNRAIKLPAHLSGTKSLHWKLPAAQTLRGKAAWLPRRTCSPRLKWHARLMGLPIKVAVGYALPPVAGGTYHCRPIPDGYAIVGVDEVVKEYEEAQLDHITGEGETQLKFAVKTTILW